MTSLPCSNVEVDGDDQDRRVGGAIQRSGSCRSHARLRRRCRRRRAAGKRPADGRLPRPDSDRVGERQRVVEEDPALDDPKHEQQQDGKDDGELDHCLTVFSIPDVVV